MKKVLIIDDDTVISQTCSLKLKSQGFQTAIANDGNSGLDAIEEFQPDAILLDLILPDISGLDLLAAIRVNPRFIKTPVILLSNHFLETGSSADIAAGLTRAMVKAETTPSKIVETLNEMLSINEPKSAAAPAVNPLQRARDRFCQDVIQLVNPMRLALHSLTRSPQDAAETYRTIKGHAETITGAAAELALTRISHLMSALAGLSHQLSERPSNATASTSRTIAGALDSLDRLAKAGVTAESGSAPLALVVEDELVSQAIVRTALDRSHIRSIVTDNGEFALQVLECNKFDLIFLDVTLPGIDGYEVCKRLRKVPIHMTTTVVFITALKEFEARTKSILSGGNDLIGKPASVTELAVKALTHLIKAK